MCPILDGYGVMNVF